MLNWYKTSKIEPQDELNIKTSQKTIPKGEGCYEQSIKLIEEHPHWSLFKGPPEPKELFWKQDTAHFWAVDEDGKVHDPTSDRYPGYDYSKGKKVKP